VNPGADANPQPVGAPAPLARVRSSCCPGYWAMYFVGSALLAAAAVYNAFDTHNHMYSAMVSLMTSKVSVAVSAALVWAVPRVRGKRCAQILGNFGLVLLGTVTGVLTWLFLGGSEPDERERVWSAARIAIVELCFNLTVFREELTVWTVARFALLLMAKYFHVLFDARMDNLERHGLTGWAEHLSFQLGLLVFGIGDVATAAAYAQTVMDTGPSVAIMFAFEHAVLLLSILLTAYRYLLWSIEQRMERQWWAKSSYFAWGSLTLNILKLALNVVYVFTIYHFFGMPLVMFREIAQAWAAVKREMGAILAARQLRQMITERFRSVGRHEIQGLQDKTCVCCYEELDADGTGAVVQLPCTHRFHVHCLMQWFDQAQTCPTCRLDLFSARAEELMRQQQPEPARPRRRQRRRRPEAEDEDTPRAPADGDDDIGRRESAGSSVSRRSSRRRREEAAATPPPAAPEPSPPTPAPPQWSGPTTPPVAHAPPPAMMMPSPPLPFATAPGGMMMPTPPFPSPGGGMMMPGISMPFASPPVTSSPLTTGPRPADASSQAWYDYQMFMMMQQQQQWQAFMAHQAHMLAQAQHAQAYAAAMATAATPDTPAAQPTNSVPEAAAPTPEPSLHIRDPDTRARSSPSEEMTPREAQREARLRHLAHESD
jgi:hypothetical protein